MVLHVEQIKIDVNKIWQIIIKWIIFPQRCVLRCVLINLFTYNVIKCLQYKCLLLLTRKNRVPISLLYSLSYR